MHWRWPRFSVYQNMPTAKLTWSHTYNELNESFFENDSETIYQNPLFSNFLSLISLFSCSKIIYRYEFKTFFHKFKITVKFKYPSKSILNACQLKTIKLQLVKYETILIHYFCWLSFIEAFNLKAFDYIRLSYSDWFW